MLRSNILTLKIWSGVRTRCATLQNVLHNINYHHSGLTDDKMRLSSVKNECSSQFYIAKATLAASLVRTHQK